MQVISLALSVLVLIGSDAVMAQDVDNRVRLPSPSQKGNLSVEQALQQRRSVREFGRGQLQLADISQILWSAQGITHADGFRTAPSAGALYPLEIYLAAGDVAGLPAGVYRYKPAGHELVLLQRGDLRGRLASAAFGQAWIRSAPAVLAIAGIYQRTTRKYGKRGRRYVDIEVGHAAQNVYLQATARGLATVMVGAFDDTEVQEVLGLPSDHIPLGLMPLGHTR
jgi:SagB-type dehydrogenase family enzyme